MKRRTRSILEEINNMIPDQDYANVIESRAIHTITAAINLITLIKEVYDVDTANELERRFLNSIRGKDTSKFVRGIRRTDK